LGQKVKTLANLKNHQIFQFLKQNISKTRKINANVFLLCIMNVHEKAQKSLVSQKHSWVDSES
jgi:hypothetical protein